jgi:D-alanine-D-alanine ligase
VCPAELEPDLAVAVTDAAAATWSALGCEGFVRVDVLAGDDGPHVIEVNAVPGLTDTSLFPMAAEAAGLGFEDACGRVVELALRRAGVAAR